MGKNIRAVSCVLLTEQLNCPLKMYNLTRHMMQHAGCQLTSSRDVPKCVVISNDEHFAAYSHNRHSCTDTSSVSQIHTVPL